MEIDWTPTWSLTEGKTRWLPTAFCYFNYPLPEEGAFCRAFTNGGAAGNNLEEAILHAFLERVERDAVGIWWYNRVRRPAIDLESFNDRFFSEMRADYRVRGWALEVIDLTTDFGIPVAAALTWDERGGHIHMGFGADLDARLAVSRAITEVYQCGIWFKNARLFTDDESAIRQGRDAIIRWLTEATLDNQSYIRPDWDAAKTAADLPNLYADDLQDDIRTCMDITRKNGMEILVLDTSRPWMDFSTVRVTVPGLRHYYPQFAPGRLYDVPVKQGWLEERLEEAELNPIPCFL